MWYLLSCFWGLILAIYEGDTVGFGGLAGVGSFLLILTNLR